MPTATADSELRVLLVDDDRDDFALAREYFGEIPGYSFALEWAADYDAGLVRARAGRHDVYVFDYRLGAKSGIDLIVELRNEGNRTPVILLTGQGRFEIDRAAAAAGAADYLEKSKLDAVILERSIRYALQAKRYEDELENKVRERTAELAAANRTLQNADRRKDEFLATLAHELRNPLAPIRNALEILRLAGSNPAATDQARQIMDRQVRQMVRLVDDLLEVSRINLGKLQINREPLSLAGVVESALEISKPLLDKAELRLVVTLPDEPITVKGDRVRLAQVFSNLLNNSAKYTEPGGTVWLEVERRGGEAVVRVRDTGVGIPAEVLPKLFELFTQVDRHLNRAQGGLGIGLALVKQLVEMHGGSVAVRSDGVDRGAEFAVTLPVA